MGLTATWTARKGSDTALLPNIERAMLRLHRLCHKLQPGKMSFLSLHVRVVARLVLCWECRLDERLVHVSRAKGAARSQIVEPVPMLRALKRLKPLFALGAGLTPARACNAGRRRHCIRRRGPSTRLCTRGGGPGGGGIRGGTTHIVCTLRLVEAAEPEGL